ncbi:unnamed protein product (macronuclear) [Paramecium tetraurelia]|uniref:Uncharacterized protein n=1 Tax=Paramecium tetraurelia TaxID=5888 RepID=A0E6V8_PARTE|nr:uncharacterized protein GSPATT00023753001 [Paramecium tetraurelia]CAK91025.1 unnamed protein product [Paramecium tetraurelia]|eukprot:XP_001458422.1 hypothetical protein (macronuclear) [Paramecium tetraurelia strain d4-2]
MTFILLQGCYVDDERDEEWDVLLFRNNQIIKKRGGRNWNINTSRSIKIELFPMRIIGTVNENGKEEGSWMYLKETDECNKNNRLNLQRVEFINGIKKINYQKTF